MTEKAIYYKHKIFKFKAFLAPVADKAPRCEDLTHWRSGVFGSGGMKAIIVGGGIGGLTAALMLHVRGIDCEVFEQTDDIRELGVGINTLPHAIKELAQLGLLPRLDAVGIRTHELFYMNRNGQEIWREPRGTDAGFEYPQFSIHRGRLQAVIYEALRDRIGESRIRTGHRLGSFTQDDGGITAHFFGRDGAHRGTVR